ncbi:hypothetical protein MMC13_007639 [Lambiella insularis]|nr:hypothetical protein [Lambiella insularis]
METNPLLRLPLIARYCLRRQQLQVPLHIHQPRQLTTTSSLHAPLSPPPAPQSSLDDLSSALFSQDPSDTSLASFYSQTKHGAPPPHHLHVFSSKHNTHITLTRPDRNPIFAVSTGNLGFRKAARGTYDAAYQLGSYVMNRIQQQGLMKDIRRVELVLRGFGDGREAIKKILLGSEGMAMRPRIVRVTDATRLKFGGTRSPKPRRL